jgi:hypothetical protein
MIGNDIADALAKKAANTVIVDEEVTPPDNLQLATGKKA